MLNISIRSSLIISALLLFISCDDKTIVLKIKDSQESQKEIYHLGGMNANLHFNCGDEFNGIFGLQIGIPSENSFDTLIFTNTTRAQLVDWYSDRIQVTYFPIDIATK